MIGVPPKIDPRTAEDVATQVRQLLMQQPWKQLAGLEFTTDRGVSNALIRIFSRFAEIIIERLNRVPEKQFLAFLDLLGASLLPPQPARVPLTFALAAGSTTDAVVPEGTQVAATPAEGEAGPIIFETERELVVTAAALTSLVVHDPKQDRYADRGAVLRTPEPRGVPIFQVNAADQLVESWFYLGHSEVLGLPHLTEVRLTFRKPVDRSAVLTTPEPSLEFGRQSSWQVWDGSVWQQITPQPLDDRTVRLDLTGHEFGPLPPLALTAAANTRSRWLRCRVPAGHTDPLPGRGDIALRVTAQSAAMAVEAACTDLIPVDLSKEFYPFGTKPAFGDTLYLAHAQAFAKAGAAITLHVTLTNPATGGEEPPLPRTRASADLMLRWEYWNGAIWRELGTAEAGARQASTEFVDTTQALTTDGRVTFRLPEDQAATTIQGLTSSWLRVRLMAGNYGAEARHAAGPLVLAQVTPMPALQDGQTLTGATRGILQNALNRAGVGMQLSAQVVTLQHGNDWLLVDKERARTYILSPSAGGAEIRDPQRSGYELIPATFAPPSIKTITVEYEVQREEPPEVVVLDYDFVTTVDPSGPPIRRFSATPDGVPALYLGFSLPPERAFPNQPLSLLVLPAETADHPDATAPPHLVWEYWQGTGWRTLAVEDDTAGLTAPGLVRFLGPADALARRAFGVERYWVRIRANDPAAAAHLRLQGLWLNTIMATQGVTIRNEILGSSDGSPGQIFYTMHTPVVQVSPYQPRLEVQEPYRPVAVPVSAAVGEPITAEPAVAEPAQDGWLPWDEKPDFYASGPHDPHYVLDHGTGAVRFGDGKRGRIPPRGSAIRLAAYTTGGGTAGNQPVGAVTQLKTTVPYVAGATNWQAAAGGVDAESLAALYARAPLVLRHGERAVAAEDYEDLARLASPAVARARCVPLLDLARDPLHAPRTPGVVSVIIVPHSAMAQPRPSNELRRRVQDFLQERSLPGIEIAVVGPQYLAVQVDVEVVPTSLDVSHAVAQAVDDVLRRFLHPLTGGSDGQGWAFGRLPERSQLMAQIGAVPGVDHIRSLTITAEADDQRQTEAIQQTGRFLIYAGLPQR
jgi:Baseplate J-like protein